MSRPMPVDATDRMQRYCDGDASAFRALHALLAAKLLAYLTHMARDRALAEDLLQHTFLKVHRARGAYVHGADPVPWIYAIAHRTFLDEARRVKRAIVRVDAEGTPPDLAAPALDDAGPDAVALAAALAALDDLPIQQREAVVLTKLEGKSVAEAAEIAGTTPGAMKVRAHRGYEALRRKFGRKP